jgi:hypothetical protein
MDGLSVYGNAWHALSNGERCKPTDNPDDDRSVIAGKVGTRAIELYGTPNHDPQRNGAAWKEMRAITIDTEGTVTTWDISGTKVECSDPRMLQTSLSLEHLLRETVWNRGDTAAAAQRITDFYKLVA